MSYPSSIPSYQGFTSTDTLAADNHAAQHNQEQSDISAIATKVGTGSSTPTNNTVLRGNGTGTTTYDQVHLDTDVKNVLGTSNGGTGSSTTTGSGLPVFQTSPTITNPTESGGTYNTATLNQPAISDFTNAQHNHQNAAGGGTLSASAITGVNSNVLSNPYKFSVYQHTAQTGLNTSVHQITFDSKNFDTSGNFSTSTSLFTAPIAGFYWFGARVKWASVSNAVCAIYLYKNGSAAVSISNVTEGTTGFPELQISGCLQLVAGDTVGVYSSQASGTKSIQIDDDTTVGFNGFLISAT